MADNDPYAAECGKFHRCCETDSTACLGVGVPNNPSDSFRSKASSSDAGEVFTGHRSGPPKKNSDRFCDTHN